MARYTGSVFNVTALVILLLLTWVLVRGVRESAHTNNVMVVIKIAAILIFVIGAAHAVNTANWHPFLPHGYSGMLTGAAIVFFTYIGFDSVSTAAEECRNPQRDLPVGIIATLIVCAALYISVALVLTGIVNWKTLNSAAPVADALKSLGMNRHPRLGQRGRAGGDDFVADGVPVRPGPHLVCDVARRAAAEGFREGTREVPDAVCQHVDRRAGGRNTGRHLGYRDVRGSVEYRHAVCVHCGVGRGAGAPQGCSRKGRADSACRGARCCRSCRSCFVSC